ncbi:ATP-binding cassette domain-containing protein [Limnobacter humi]|uniref:ATP-binding cassette domain-containing protein n=1 Tax=Limnobacter humi TaxID=1778671 RepID=A0ABT1WJ46_9BURK|nr:ATP-binding cassette domain-containing protein [Limnobacter humi]MCQ8896439.1 ATP-binding cassette domain-containing protein [Limnobacter humi]
MSVVPTMIELRDVSVQAQGKVLLHIPQLSVSAGERVAVLGRNGAGKSTLLRVLNGFVKPESGTVRVNGSQVYPFTAQTSLKQVRADIGQVLQGLHLVPRLSVLENVLVGGVHRMPVFRSWCRIFNAGEIAQAQAALTAVNALHLANTRADRLSGGERQKVAIARMLMQAPRLVLADEPTAALDPTAADEVCDLLVKASTGTTLLTVVHQVELVPRLANRVLGLQHGQLVLDCPVNQLDQQQLDALYA